VGNVRPYSQNYFEAGWTQELHPRVSLELNAYLHNGHNRFENHEISISRTFVPINFHAARSEGAELVVNMRQLEHIGISGRFQYALQKTYFYGPITGGFAGDEPLTAVRESFHHSTKLIPGPHRSSTTATVVACWPAARCATEAARSSKVAIAYRSTSQQILPLE